MQKRNNLKFPRGSQKKSWAEYVRPNLVCIQTKEKTNYSKKNIATSWAQNTPPTMYKIIKSTYLLSTNGFTSH